MNKEQQAFVYNGFLDTLRSIRPDAVGLVDSFDFPDKVWIW